MEEYWLSAREACLKLLGCSSDAKKLSKSVPQAFKKLRPWVHQGWEMVLLAAEMVRPDSTLVIHGSQEFASNYQTCINKSLDIWHWDQNQLQDALDSIRRDAITKNYDNWIRLHKPFPHVIQLIKQLEQENFAWTVLSTKSAEFTSEILKTFELNPLHVYGHEAGSKTHVLLELAQCHTIKGFIEDRRSTLEEVLRTPGIADITCYLASWGYLKPKDLEALPPNIHLLQPKTLTAPLAAWH